jgi:hypothetical protein
MTEVEWGSEGKEAPKKKKAIPGWAWFCGGGCVLALIAAVVLGIVAFVFGREAMNQETQWDALRQVIQVDEPDPDDRIIFGLGFTPGVEEAWQISSKDGTGQANLMVYSGDMAAKLREAIETGENADLVKQALGVLGDSKATAGTTTLQGREFKSLSFQPKDASIVNPAMVAIDATPEGDARIVLLGYRRMKASDAPIAAEELETFFEPFHLGPQR